MARVLVSVLALAATGACQSVPGVYASDGRVAIGRVTGGSFGQGSFTVGEPGRNYGSGSDGHQQQDNNKEQESDSKPPFVYGRGKVLYGSTRASNGQVAIGRVTGGTFAPGSFSTGEPGRSGSSGYGGNQPQTWNRQDWYNVPRYNQYNGYYANRNVLPGSTRARNGQVAIGRMTGGSFGPGSFSVGEPGRSGSSGYGGYQPQAWNRQRGYNYPRYNQYNGYRNQNANPNHPYITGFNRGDGTSIAIDKISGGSYPDGSFSIGHGV